MNSFLIINEGIKSLTFKEYFSIFLQAKEVALKRCRKLLELNYVVKLAVIFSLLIFSGCATKEAVKNLTDEDQLKERVMAYWSYKVNQEFDKSYEYEAPFFRNTTSLVKYIRSFKSGRLEWKGAEVKSLKIDGSSAIIDLKISIRLDLGPSSKIEHEVPLKEKWVRVDGTWYNVPQKFREQTGMKLGADE